MVVKNIVMVVLFLVCYSLNCKSEDYSTADQIRFYFNNEATLKGDVTQILKQMSTVFEEGKAQGPSDEFAFLAFFEFSKGIWKYKSTLEALKLLSLNKSTDDTKMHERLINISDIEEERRLLAEEFKQKTLSATSENVYDYYYLLRVERFGYALAPRVDYEGLVLNSKIRLEKEDCSDRHGNKKTASVKEFKLNTQICFSLKDLARVPPDSLQREIHSLYIHELAHTVGLQEGPARVIQKYVYENYNFLTDRPQISARNFIDFFKLISQLEYRLDRTIRTIPKASYSKSKTFISANFCHALDSLNYLADEIIRSSKSIMYPLDRALEPKEELLLNLESLFRKVLELDSLHNVLQCYHIKGGWMTTRWLNGTAYKGEGTKKFDMNLDIELIDHNTALAEMQSGSYEFLYERLSYFQKRVSAIKEYLAASWLISEEDLYQY